MNIEFTVSSRRETTLRPKPCGTEPHDLINISSQFIHSVASRQKIYIVELWNGGGSVAEQFRRLDLRSEGPLFKSSTPALSGFGLGNSEVKSSTAMGK